MSQAAHDDTVGRGHDDASGKSSFDPGFRNDDGFARPKGFDHWSGGHGWGGGYDNHGGGIGSYGGGGGHGGSSPPCVCFMPQTLIATPSGSSPVESLKIGDLVLTAEGKSMPVRWVGRLTVSMDFADPGRVLPVRIRAGAIGEGLPSRDLLVSPKHAIYVDGILVNAGALVNGSTIVRESQVPQTFTYFHIELEDHSLILAEGVPAETFVDNVDREAFDNWDEHARLFPDGHPVPELPYPRASTVRQVPEAIVRRLAARAAAVAGPLRAAA